jgi:RNA exonuclease 4
VAPQEKVIDYRTFVSGVRPSDLKGAPSFHEVQNAVSIATKGKVIIGHSLQHDLKALMLTHDKKLIRDTAKYRPYQVSRRERE